MALVLAGSKGFRAKLSVKPLGRVGVQVFSVSLLEVIFQELLRGLIENKGLCHIGILQGLYSLYSLLTTSKKPLVQPPLGPQDPKLRRMVFADSSIVFM